jgi:hypothetical protein
MNLRYTVDETSLLVSIFVENNLTPIINQPYWPNGTPWGDANDASLWAQLCILSIVNPEAPYAPAGPGLSGEPKII